MLNRSVFESLVLPPWVPWLGSSRSSLSLQARFRNFRWRRSYAVRQVLQRVFRPRYDALVRAALYTDLSTLSRLIEEGADPNTRIDDESLLTYAVNFAGPEKEASEVVALLIDSGADPNLVFRNAGGPLSHAVMSSDFRAVDLLLSRGANPNIVHYYPECPETALDLAYSELHLYTHYLEEAREKVLTSRFVGEWKERIAEYEERIAALPQIISTLESVGGETYYELCEAGPIAPELLPREPR